VALAMPIPSTMMDTNTVLRVTTMRQGAVKALLVSADQQQRYLQ